ncbi:hypothetical protein EON64_11025 [archaeon]|nr:MAG: hypothetical protein EON64_11025 [archaeon]
MPKVKKAALAATSPFALPGTSPPALAAKPLTTSSPPGAHEELYRMVQNPTRLNAADPDRVCVNSTRMLEGLRVLPQPPWFLGYQNKPAPPDGNFLLAAQRYGYRGSQEMQQQSVLPCAPASEAMLGEAERSQYAGGYSTNLPVPGKGWRRC